MTGFGEEGAVDGLFPFEDGVGVASEFEAAVGHILVEESLLDELTAEVLPLFFR